MKQEWRCDKKSEACVDMSADVPLRTTLDPGNHQLSGLSPLTA